MTVSEDYPSQTDDPQASLRTELLGQLVAAQFDLEAAIGELTRDGAPAPSILETRSQLGSIVALRQQVAGADVRTLAAMRTDIAAMVAAGRSATQQARAADDARNADNIANIAQNARTTVTDVMRNMKDFDGDLRFANTQEEADYHRREAERQSYIAAEQAKHTPEGDLNASGGAVGQMADAAAHGAANNPQFQQRWDKLVASTDVLREQLIRDGKDVSQFDVHLRNDLRTIMRAKGVPDAKIDALLAAHEGNPLDAAKAFVAEQKGVIGDKEIGELAARAAAYKAAEPDDRAPKALSTATPPASIPSSALDAMAELMASGVVASQHEADSPPAHGVSVAVQPAQAQSVGTRS